MISFSVGDCFKKYNYITLSAYQYLIVLSCSGNLHDNVIILKQESGYADVYDNSFLKVSYAYFMMQFLT